MTRALGNEAIQATMVGATGGAAIYHFSDQFGLGLDKDTIGHIAPLLSFILGWVWVLFYQEVFARFNVHLVKSACRRRIAEIDELLKDQSLNAARISRLEADRDDCIALMSKLSANYLAKRAAFVLNG